MRNQLIAAVALTVITSGFSCARSEPAREPEIPRSATATPTPAEDLDRMRGIAEASRDPVPESLRGFEGATLPPPEPIGGGPAAESDVGGPAWRNSPGTFAEDPNAAVKNELQRGGEERR